jgi:hypothetical protein
LRRLKLLIVLLVACQSVNGQFYQYDKFILTESDKQLHFAAGAIATTVGYEWALKKYKGDKKKAFFVGLGVGLAAGIAKESFDNWRGFPYYFDERDVLATFMGSVAVSIPLSIFRKPKVKYTN